MRMGPVNLYDYEDRAKQVLPSPVWDFIDAGAMDEITTRRNRHRLRRPHPPPPLSPGHLPTFTLHDPPGPTR